MNELNNVSIEDGHIVIRLPIAALPLIVDHEHLDEEGAPAFILTDVHAFAAAVVHELRHESEDGTTMVHKMFDNAVLDAIDSGADGVEEIP